MAINRAEMEIFGTQDAFSQRWTRLHGVPDVIPANPAAGINRDFSPAEVFSEVADTGLSDQPAWYRASLAIEASKDKNFRVSARNGFLRLLALDHTMRAGRIDSVANILKTEMGVTPQGIAQWLLVDQETRRCLTLLLRLQGYPVADEEGIHDKIKDFDYKEEGRKLGWVDKRFSEAIIIRDSNHEIMPYLTSDKVKAYLKAIQDTVGTDPGVVRLAYTIFRCLGFYHENGKFAEDLVGKYVYVAKNADPKSPDSGEFAKELARQFGTTGKDGDLDPAEVAPFIEKFDDGTGKKITLSNGKERKVNLADNLATGGVIEMTRGLNRLPGEEIARKWVNMQILLDMMDKLSDIRAGTGACGGMKYSHRQSKIMALEQTIDEFGLSQAKRLLEPSTMLRLKDWRKVKYQKGMLEKRQKGLTDFVRDIVIEIPGFRGQRPTKG